MEAPPDSKPSYSALLKNRSFSRLFVGQLISQSGDAVFDVALLWLVLATTGSTVLVGLTQAAVLIPAVLVSPLAGVYADRVNRRNIMVVSNLFQGAITAAVSVLYLLSSLHYALLIVLVLALYSGAQFYRAASGAIIPRMVGKGDLGAANGLLTLSQSFNQLVGYSAGGIVIYALGPAVPITYDSVTFFAASFVLILIAKSHGTPRAASDPSVPRASFSVDFKEGLRYVRGNKLFLEIMVLGLLVNFFFTAASTLMAPYAKFAVHGNASTYGFLSSAFALGVVVGSILIGKVNFRRYVGKLVFFGITGVGLLIATAGLVTSIPIAFADFVAVGILLAAVNVPISAVIQARIPGEMLGRVNTVLGATLAAAQPVAAVLAGVLAGLATVSAVFVGSGVAAAGATLALYPVFKELGSAQY
ncbi:MAG: MFS transporter [Nitrososphaerota archaeon]|nr:MFS transporter [Nitrososphaerota archaeon]